MEGVGVVRQSFSSTTVGGRGGGGDVVDRRIFSLYFLQI